MEAQIQPEIADGYVADTHPAPFQGGVVPEAVFEADDVIVTLVQGTVVLELDVRANALAHHDSGRGTTGASASTTGEPNLVEAEGVDLAHLGARTGDIPDATQRARRGIIENMEVRGASSRSIHFANETAFPNGLYPSEIIVRNNVIQDSGFVAGYATPLKFLFSGEGSSAQSIGPRLAFILCLGVHSARRRRSEHRANGRKARVDTIVVEEVVHLHNGLLGIGDVLRQG